MYIAKRTKLVGDSLSLVCKVHISYRYLSHASANAVVTKPMTHRRTQI